MGLLWARDFEDLWEVHGSRCSFFVPSCPRMLVANDIAARSHLYDIYIYMHTSKISSSWVTRNKTYCTCTARNYITLSTVLCHLASEYQREKNQFCPVAPCSNDRVLFASMLQVFIASMNKRKQHFWLPEDFILSPSSTASSRAPYIKRYGMFCQGKHIVPLKNVVLLNPSTASTQILRATACFS